MKNIDKETILKIMICFSISGFLYYLICSNRIGDFVHPRIVAILKVSIILFIIIAFALLFQLNNKSYVKRKLTGYYIYIIPLLILFIAINFAPTSKYIASNINSIREKIASDNAEVITHKTMVKVPIKSDKNTFEVNDENFIDFLNLVNNNFDDISNKTIIITGFIYKDNSINKNEFALVRILMSCCSADTKVVGIICNNQLDKTLKNDSWVKVTGRLERNKEGEVTLKINDMNLIDKPKNIYIYYH